MDYALASIFPYETLREGLSIRLIDLHPAANASSDLRCNIIHVDLLDAVSFHPPYTALSYAWGSAEKTCILWCNTGSLAITASLDAALRAVRKTTWNLLIWADAVCINQENVQERNFQVANMIHIYSRASSVLVWIGEDDVEKRGARCLEWLQIIGRYPNFALRCEISPSDMTLLESFFDRDWFKRRWVIQEVVVAAQAFVICGSKRISWYDFIESVALLRTRYGPAVPPTPHIETLDKLCMIENVNKGHKTAWTESTKCGKPTLLQIMFHFEASLCSDDKDRVFSLIRLAGLGDEDSEAMSPIFNYSLTTESVYKRLAGALLKPSDQYALLHFAATFRPEILTPDALPSWVPDWRVRSRVRPLLHEDFKCGLRRPGVVSINTDGSLSIQGCIYDRVASYDTMALQPKAGSNDLPDALDELIHQHTVEEFSAVRGAIIPSLLHDGSSSINFFHPKSKWQDARALLEEAAQEVKASSEEHALIAQESWLSTDTEVDYRPADYIENLLKSKTLRGRRFFVTQKGSMGIGPSDAEQGDTVAILYGTRTPFILRQVGTENEWRIIGDAYVSGITRAAVSQRRTAAKELRIV